MTNVEKIRAEIERLKETVGAGLDAYDMGHENGAFEAYEKVLSFIDSLPEEPFDYTNATIVQKDFAEPISDDLEKVAEQYAWSNSHIAINKKTYKREEVPSIVNTMMIPIADKVKIAVIYGGKWNKNQIIDKACEWLKGVLYVEERYSPDGNFVESDARSVEEFINEFRKAMEDKK